MKLEVALPGRTGRARADAGHRVRVVSVEAALATLAFGALCTVVLAVGASDSR